MERSVDVRTGEAVAITYELAGLGSRFLAVAVDALAQGAILIAFFVAAAFATPALVRVLPSKYLAGVELAILVIVLFVVIFGWFVLFEIWWSGRTPGKRALGLRVVRDGGFPVDAGAAVIRNLVRLVELIFGFYALSAVSALLSRENKRLGDFAAGTIVVRDRADAAPDLDAYLAAPAAADGLASESDRLLVQRFLARRTTFEPAARARLARRIAEKLRPKLPEEYRRLDDEPLLERIGSSR